MDPERVPAGESFLGKSARGPSWQYRPSCSTDESDVTAMRLLTGPDDSEWQQKVPAGLRLGKVVTVQIHFAEDAFCGHHPRGPSLAERWRS